MQFLKTIEARFQSLLLFPLSGPAREQFAAGLRVMFHNRYAVYYRVLPDELVIIRVLHGARDVDAIAEHGGFPAE